MIVHCYDFRMTKQEIESFLEEKEIPRRFYSEEIDVVDSKHLLPYALFVNSVKYKNRQKEKEDEVGKKQELIKLVELFLEEGYLIEFFQKKEVVNMALESLTERDIIEIQAREEGKEEGREEGMIIGSIEAFLSLGLDEKNVKKNIMEKYHLIEEDYENYLKEAKKRL